MKLALFGLVGGLLGGLLLVAHVLAAVTGTLGVGSITLAPGDQGSVSVTASVPSPGLGAWTVDVIIGDPAQVSVLSCSATADSVCNPHYQGGKVRFAGATAMGHIGQINLGTITLRCASSEGTSALDLDTVGFADATIGGPVEIAVTMSPGSVRCNRAEATAGGPGATATTAASGLPPTGTGGAGDTTSLGSMIAALTGLGLAAIGGYSALRLRRRRS